MLCKDREATKARHFANEKSHVRFDEAEILYGNDWKQRVAELLARCGGQCEYMIPVFDFATMPPSFKGYNRCSNEARDPDHIVRRSRKRDDRLQNLQALCGMHHEGKHPEKRPMWTKRLGGKA